MSLSSLFGYTGSRTVDGVVLTKTMPTYTAPVVTEPAPATKTILQPMGVEGVYSKPFVPDAPTILQDATKLYEGNLTLNNSGIMGQITPGAFVDRAVTDYLQPYGPADGSTDVTWVLALRQSSGDPAAGGAGAGQNGIYKMTPGGFIFQGFGPDFIGVTGGTNKGKIYKQNVVRDAAGNTLDVHYIDTATGLRTDLYPPTAVAAKVTDAIKTATGLTIKPLYILAAVVLLFGLWFAHKKGLLKF